MRHSTDQDSTKKNKSELKSLQILRAVAATSVVYFHIGSAASTSINIPVFGSFGVDIFFVISGFVMAMVVSNGQGPRSFVISRLSRIIPLYWILTTCLLLLAAIKPELLNSTTVNLLNYLKSLFFIPYFKENGTLYPMLSVGWTLNYEMFFYFCIWISLIFAKRYYIQSTIILISIFYFVVRTYVENDVITLFFGNTLIFEFVFGMLLYKLFITRKQKNYSSPYILIATFSYVFMCYAESSKLSFDRIIIYGIPSILLIYSMLNLENLFTNANRKIVSFLTNIGDESYATYLSHFYVVESVRRILYLKFNLLNPYSIFGATLIVILALIVGHFLYVFIDKPISKYCKRKFSTTKPSAEALKRQSAI
ncbi:MAG: acyltransferase [Methylococcaceae bacterium]|nr:acyltransferase [Methylococcaceae bacterium]MDP3904544.1 acyltransferase [Methylococcaceae bacterium]